MKVMTLKSITYIISEYFVHIWVFFNHIFSIKRSAEVIFYISLISVILNYVDITELNNQITYKH